jgi:ATP-binding cassette, subfamily B, bacterial
MMDGPPIKQALRIDRALRLVWRSAPGWTLVNLVLVVVQGLLPLAGLYLMKEIVDAVTAGIAAPDKAAGFQPALFRIILAGGIALLAALARSLGDLAGETQSQIVTDSVSDLLHAQSIAVDLEYYENPAFQDTLHRAQQEAPFRPTRILQGLIDILQNGLSLVGVVALLFSFNYILALLLLAAALPTGLVRLLFARRSYHFEQELTEKERKAWYYHFLMTDPGQAKEVRLFHLGPLFQGRFRDLRKSLREGRLAFKGRRSWMDFLAQSLATLAVFGSLALIAGQTIRGAITLGSLVIYYQGFQMGLGSFQAVLRGLAGLYEDNLFLNNFYRFLDLQPKVEIPTHPRPVPALIRKIHFQGVDFHYPGKKQKVLARITLALHPGEVIALVGENGSGKTTLIKLLCRLYDPTGGTITVDGIDLREFDPTEWRRRIGILFQDYAHYYLTAAENIGLGKVEENKNLKEIIRAARLAGADPIIRRLPEGYDTILGTWFEGGQELSTGEWQKIALARTFFRQAPIMVLDEPTSSLDPLAEAELFRQFKEVIRDRAGILISHRYSTVRLADRIFVLHQGRIIEEGTHGELVRQGGRYGRLFAGQRQV